MKKNYYYLLAAMLFITVLWISCKKGTANQSELSDSKVTVSLTSEEIAAWHNKALALMSKSNSNNSNNIATSSIGGKASFLEIREKILQELIKNDPSTFKESEIRASLKTLDDINTSAEIQAQTNGSIDKMGLIISALRTRNVITQKLSTELEKIHVLSRSGVSVDKVKEAVNALKVESFNESEKKYVETFVAVYNSSYDYWLTNKATTATTLKVSSEEAASTEIGEAAPSGCNQIIIGADAVGALYGMITGPITSVLESATFSFLASINPPCEN